MSSREPELVPAKDAATFAKERKQYHAADVVGISRRHVVLVTRSKEPQKGLLAIPGGMVRPEETYGDAARREFQEETGQTLPNGRPNAAGVFDDEGRDPRGVPIRSHAFCYVFDDDAENMPLKGEQDLNARWVPFEKLRDAEFCADHRHVFSSLLKAAGDAVPEALRTLFADEVLAAAKVCSSETAIDELLKAKPEGPILCIDLVVASADEKSFLLVKRPEEPNLLSAIIGTIKPTEAPWDTCLRKLREIGIVLEDVEPRPAMFFEKGKRDGVEVATFLYWVKLCDDAKEKLSLKVGGAEWVNVDERRAEEFFADHFTLLTGCRRRFG